MNFLHNNFFNWLFAIYLTLQDRLCGGFGVDKAGILSPSITDKHASAESDIELKLYPPCKYQNISWTAETMNKNLCTDKKQPQIN